MNDWAARHNITSVGRDLRTVTVHYESSPDWTERVVVRDGWVQTLGVDPDQAQHAIQEAARALRVTEGDEWEELEAAGELHDAWTEGRDD